jgi:hydroxymethylbilane synthase
VRLGATDHRRRQGETLRIAVLGRALDSRSTGLTKTKQFGGFVERLAKRVIDGGGEPDVLADIAHQQRLRVATRHEQQHVRRRQPLGQADSERMRLQVIDGNQRFGGGQRQRLGCGQADNQPADQPRASRHGDAVQLIEPEPGSREGFTDQRVQAFDMGAGGDLRNDPTKSAVLLPLRSDDVGEDAPSSRCVAQHHGCRGLIAAGFDAKHQCFARCHLGRSSFVLVLKRHSGHVCANNDTRGELSPGGLMTQASARRIRIGTRGSPLALAQAEDVRARLIAAHGLMPGDCEIVVIKTSGDRILDRPLSEAGGKGLFTKEIEEALLDGSIHLAVHSMKDMPTELPAGLVIACMLPREDVRDAFISLRHPTFADLPQGATLGTSSLRRSAQAAFARPDLNIVGFRGNVQTRLGKLADGVADATFLAVAGLNRLGRADRITQAIPTDVMLPAVSQGAVGIEIRDRDEATRALLAPLDDAATSAAVKAERVFLRRLEGSCRTPIAGLAEFGGDTVTFRGQILTPDGRQSLSVNRTGPRTDADRLADDAAIELLSRAGPQFFTAHAGSA